MSKAENKAKADKVKIEDHVLTQEDINLNQALEAEGLKVGDLVGLVDPEVISDEEKAEAIKKAEKLAEKNASKEKNKVAKSYIGKMYGIEEVIEIKTKIINNKKYNEITTDKGTSYLLSDKELEDIK